MRLAGKSAVVTGGAGGIGSATCRAFAREGAKVVVADRDMAGAKALSEELCADGGEATAVAVDMTRAAEVEALVAAAEERFGKLDVMFNNAGIFHPADGSVVETSEEVWAEVIDINLKGVFLGCKYAVPALERAGGGALINTASFVATMGAAVSQSAYTASKGGVLALTREIAVEFARKGIRANAICPGPIDTPMLAKLFEDERARDRRLVHLPMGRLGKAEDIAEAAVYLASDGASYVSGTEFMVDGGIRAAYVTPE